MLKNWTPREKVLLGALTVALVWCVQLAYLKHELDGLFWEVSRMNTECMARSRR